MEFKEENKDIDSSEDESKDIFPKNFNKEFFMFFGFIAMVMLALIGYLITQSGSGPMAGVEGDHKVCTVKDMNISYYSDKEGKQEYFDGAHIKNLTVKTKSCGDLIIDKKHLSNIDGMLELYQNIDNGKTYEFRIVDGKYVNHVDLAL